MSGEIGAARYQHRILRPFFLSMEIIIVMIMMDADSTQASIVRMGRIVILLLVAFVIIPLSTNNVFGESIRISESKIRSLEIDRDFWQKQNFSYKIYCNVQKTDQFFDYEGGCSHVTSLRNFINSFDGTVKLFPEFNFNPNAISVYFAPRSHETVKKYLGDSIDISDDCRMYYLASAKDLHHSIAIVQIFERSKDPEYCVFRAFLDYLNIEEAITFDRDVRLLKFIIKYLFVRGFSAQEALTYAIAELQKSGVQILIGDY